MQMEEQKRKKDELKRKEKEDDMEIERKLEQDRQRLAARENSEILKEGKRKPEADAAVKKVRTDQF
jgi:hypothetical protein